MFLNTFCERELLPMAAGLQTKCANGFEKLPVFNVKLRNGVIGMMPQDHRTTFAEFVR